MEGKRVRYTSSGEELASINSPAGGLFPSCQVLIRFSSECRRVEVDAPRSPTSPRLESAVEWPARRARRELGVARTGEVDRQLEPEAGTSIGIGLAREGLQREEEG